MTHHISDSVSVDCEWLCAVLAEKIKPRPGDGPYIFHFPPDWEGQDTPVANGVILSFMFPVPSQELTGDNRDE